MNMIIIQYNGRSYIKVYHAKTTVLFCKRQLPRQVFLSVVIVKCRNA